MNVIRLTKEFHFEMAHALYGYDGPCKNIHGHSYSLKVTVMGEVPKKRSDPKEGMLMDFTDLKRIVTKNITDQLDHALVLNGRSPHKIIAAKEQLFEKIILMDFQPTCENLLIHFVSKIKPLLPKGVSLHHLYLRETPSSYAEWFADDNKKK